MPRYRPMLGFGALGGGQRHQAPNETLDETEAKPVSYPSRYRVLLWMFQALPDKTSVVNLFNMTQAESALKSTPESNQRV